MSLYILGLLDLKHPIVLISSILILVSNILEVVDKILVEVWNKIYFIVCLLKIVAISSWKMISCWKKDRIVSNKI